MKESYVEGLAAHDDPESCGDTCKGVDEALTGGRASQVFSRESNHPPGCRRRKERRKATSEAMRPPVAEEPRAVKDTERMRKHLAREPGDALSTSTDAWTGRVGKSKDARR